MMGRGAEGGSHQLLGSESTPGSGVRVDIYSQVLKEVASDDSPRENSECNGETFFPLSVVSYPSKGSGLFGSKKRNRSKKTQPRSRDSRPVGKHGQHADDSPAAGDFTAGPFWSQMDDYFRDVTTSDVQLLLPATMFHLSENGTVSDPCLLIPPLGQHYTEKWAEEDLQQADQVSEQIVPRPKRKLPSSGSTNKKCKRSGELITIVSPLSEQEDGDEVCHVCNSGDSDESNQIIFCDICNVAVHQLCYGVRVVPEGQWLCSWCSWKASKKAESSTFDCVLCPSKGGALKPVAEVDSKETIGRAGTKFAHVFCSIWVPEAYFGSPEDMEPICNIEGVRDERWRLLCSICKEKHGACIQCSHGMCATAFHPLCAKDAKLYMEVCSLEDSENEARKEESLIEYRAYCSRHSAAHMGKASVVLSEGLDAGTSLLKPTDVAEKPRGNGTLVGMKASEGEVDVVMTEQMPHSSSIGPFVDDAQVSAGQPQIDSSNLDNGQNNVVNATHAALKSERGECEGSKVEALNEGPDPLQPTPQEQQGFEQGIQLVASPSLQPGEASQSSHPDNVDRVKQEISRSNVKSSDNVEGKSSMPKHQHLLHRRPSYATSEGSKGQDASGLAEGEASGEVATLCDDKGSDERRQRGLSGEASTSHSHATSHFDSPAVPAQTFNSPSSDKPHVKETLDRTPGIEVSEEDVSQSGAEVQKSICQAFAHPQIEQRLREYQAISATNGQFSAIYHPVESQVSSEFEIKAVEVDANEALDIQWNQLRTAEKEGVLKLAPDDEIEGEILVLQNSLLSRAEENRHRCEKLISKMIPKLPVERASSLRRMKELDFVHRYVSQKREVKKQGRKEKRHKEAQAVLAAATAAAAASPRAGYIKRDALPISDIDNQTFSPSQENAYDYSPGVLPSAIRRLKPPVPRVSHSTSPYPPLSARSGYQARAGTESAVLRTGYGQLLLDGEESACDVCTSQESSRGNRILTCSSCKVNVHQECYGVNRVPQGAWFCQPCTELQRQSQSLRSPGIVPQANMLWAQCGLCCRGGGALKRSTDGRWVHVFCAQWMPETSTEGVLIEGMESVNPERFALLCSVCQRQEGACLTCNFGHCHGAFHPPCARDSGLYMTVRISTGGRLQYRAYCDRHSVVQRDKDEQVEQRQRSGNEELHALRQIRVEFERVRLMCERICRRERLKRELLQTNKDIAVAQLLSAAHVEMGNLEQLPEPTGRTRELPLASIQQAHHNPMIVTSDETREHTRRHKKMKKHGRTRLHREQLMTPMEASILNMRLPKGYAYVPVDVYVKGTIIPTQPDGVEKELQQLPPTSLPPT